MSTSEPAPPSDPVANPPVDQDEFGVRCPDGTIWDDRYDSADEALTWAILGDKECGCEESGHLAIQRGPWQTLPPLSTDSAQSAATDAGRAADAPGPYPSSALPSDGA